MKQNERTDRSFRNMEASYTSSPSANVWDKIEKDLKQQNSKKGIWLFLSIGVLSLCATGLGFQYFQAPKSKTTQYSVSQSNIAPTTAATFVQSGDEDNSTSQTEPNLAQHKSSIQSLYIGENRARAGVVKKETYVIEPTIQNNVEENNMKVEVARMPNFENSAIIVGETENSTESIAYLENTPVSDMTEDLELLQLDDPCPAMSRKNKKSFFTELGGNVGSHYKNFHENSENLSSIRKSSEKEWYTWGGYGGLGIYLTPNFYVRADVDWMQQKDLFEYNRDGISRMIIEYDPATGQQISSHTVNGTWSSQGEIRRTYLDAGLNFGYMFQRRNVFKQAWQVGIEPGLLYNISVESEGKVMTAVDQISRLENENGLYNTKLGLGYQAQLIIEKPMESGFKLLIKPYYRNYLNAYGKDPNGISIPGFGVKAGLRKVF